MDLRPITGNFGFPIGVALAVVVTFVTVAAGATHHPDWAVIALAATIAVVSVITTPSATIGTAAVSWFLVAGFVIGREGQISVSPAAEHALLVLALTGLASCAVMSAVRWTRVHAAVAAARPRHGH